MRAFLDLLVRNVDKVVYGLGTVCLLLVAADLFYDKGGHYDFERFTGFHAIYGFCSYVGLILVSKQLRKALMRPEDYYEPDAPYENVSGERLDPDAHEATAGSTSASHPQGVPGETEE